MINGKGVYDAVAALVPLYVPMILAYASVWRWKIFTPEQCSGINRFVAVFAVPFLNFHFLSSNDPYGMNLRFIAADTLQKVVILAALFLWSTFTKCGSLDYTLTLFSLSSLPNTLIVGVPLLTAMYGDSSASLMSQIVVTQSVLWVTLTLFLYEYRGAKRLVSKQFPENGGSITSLSVDSDVSSLNGNEPLQADAEMKGNGELHVVVRSPSLNNSCNCSTDICAVQSSMQRASSFNTTRDLRSDAYEVEMWKIREDRTCRSNTCNDLFNAVKHESMDMTPSPKAIGDREVGIVDGIQYPSSDGLKEVKIEEGDANKKQQTPRASIMTGLVLTMVWRNLMRNPNTYASVFGLAWSLISFRWNIKMPSVVNGSILILSKTGMGMAMFSLGLFMALQPKIVACGKTWIAISMIARFVVGPAVIAITSIVIGIRGVLLRVAIVQAALPQAIATFVFAKEYNLHADIMSTA
ncbi:Auxin efflux carrier component 2 [Spatholobus suberectus]|nr:Auxin efflux carrier component 2 [Spatholobus suberectus]